MGENNKTVAEKELATKNLRVVIIVGLVAVGFYSAIVLTYM